MPARRNRPYSIERKLPLTLLFTAFLQLMTLVSWATYLEARVDTLETRMQGITPLTAGMARVEERVEGIRGNIIQIRQQLDRMGDRLMKPGR